MNQEQKDSRHEVEREEGQYFHLDKNISGKIR